MKSEGGREMSRYVSRAASVALVALLGVLLSGVSGGAAVASTLPPSGGGATSGTTVEVVNRCVLYANASRFGANCAGGKSGQTIKDILHGQDFMKCIYEGAPEELIPLDKHVGEPGQWLLKICLDGIKPDGTGDYTYTTEVIWWEEGREIPQPTVYQADAWDRFEAAYPQPIAQFGPATVPRALIPTFFWLTDETGADISKTVWDGTRNVQMRARVEQIEIKPGREDGERPLVCPGRGVPYDHSRGIYAQGSNCVVEYDRSSAYKPNDHYVLTLQSNWVVEYQRADGSWRQLGTFPMDGAMETAVDEIQTVVS